jgi:hypothetical protein
MTRDEILAAFDRIRVWQQGDRRAVHKPLLVLLALGRLLRGESPVVEFAGIEDKLGKLLEEFGPSGSEKTRHNPHLHLLGIFAPTASGSLPGRPKSPPDPPAPRRHSPSCGAAASPADSPSRSASRSRAILRSSRKLPAAF